jgi:hypothetical protein
LTLRVCVCVCVCMCVCVCVGGWVDATHGGGWGVALQASQLQVTVIATLERALTHDFTPLTESRKKFARASDDADSALAKYASRKPGKDAAQPTEVVVMYMPNSTPMRAWD